MNKLFSVMTVIALVVWLCVSSPASSQGSQASQLPDDIRVEARHVRHVEPVRLSGRGGVRVVDAVAIAFR